MTSIQIETQTLTGLTSLAHHADIDTTVLLYDVRLLFEIETEASEDEDEEDEEQQCTDSDYRDVAGVWQRRRVRSLCWNHVGQIQHVAQCPARIAAFYLKTEK